MRQHTIRILTALFVALTCTLAAASASANRSIEVTGGPNVLASARLQFIGTEGNNAFEIICDVTLHRTLTRNIPKVRGTLFGKLTGISIKRGGTTRSPNCAHGSLLREIHDITPLRAPSEPCPHSEDGRGVLRYDCSGAEARLWKLIYDSFQGTLPRINGVNVHIQNIQFLVRLLEPFGGTVECLYEGNAFGLITINADGTATRAETRRALSSIPLQAGSGAVCPRAGTWEGTFTVTPTLTIRLI